MKLFSFSPKVPMN